MQQKPLKDAIKKHGIASSMLATLKRNENKFRCKFSSAYMTPYSKRNDCLMGRNLNWRKNFTSGVWKKGSKRFSWMDRSSWPSKELGSFDFSLGLGGLRNDPTTFPSRRPMEKRQPRMQKQLKIGSVSAGQSWKQSLSRKTFGTQMKRVCFKGDVLSGCQFMKDQYNEKGPI